VEVQTLEADPFRLGREDEGSRSAREAWHPIPCTGVTPVRRYFDLQAGTIWTDLRSLLPRVTGTLIDVGCGAQPYRGLLNDRVDYLGIDTVDAGSAFGYETAGTRYYDGKIWPVDDGSADVVLATETLEHVVDPGRFIDEAARVLKPAGTLILTVPFAARWHYVPHDYWRFTPSGFLQLLSPRGFESVRVYARGNSLTVACYKWIALFLPFILPQKKSPITNVLLRLFGLMLAPLFIGVAIIGNVSLRSGGGDDCLGYTVVARKKRTTTND